MKVYVTWDKTIDVQFRKIYKEVTYEEVQETPEETADGTRFLVGSGILSLNKQNRLRIALGKSQLSDKVSLYETHKPPFKEPVE